MKIKAQVSMVLNLDKCLGCHQCSVTCKNTWTNREGTEYMYFNNVETRPGLGYPRNWEDQDKWKGGWQIDSNGKLALATGSKGKRLLKLFYHPEQPELKDYFEPWTYDYETLITSKRKNHQPIARPKSLVTGEKMEVTWGPNWDDDLAGGHHARTDLNLKGLGEQIKFDYKEVFMRYLPRLCNHCLNPACVAACPSGAIYKRTEDGVVLVNQDVCRGWRHCVPACPYKKIFYNWETNKAEKCVFCYPRLENGRPQICAETCTGRIRFSGVVLYDMDRVAEMAETKDDMAIYDNMLELILDPHDPEVIKAAKEEGISQAWLEAAQNSPVYKLVKEWKVALPLHPEYRTLPMVWYVPPMSPIVQRVSSQVYLAKADEMRVPLTYLASLFSAGNTEVVGDILQKLLDMRMYMKMRTQNDGMAVSTNPHLSDDDMYAMYKLLALAKYKDRFVLPTDVDVDREKRHEMQHNAGFTCPTGGCHQC